MTADATSEDAARLRRALWLFAAAICAHELEEWNISSWFARNFPGYEGLSHGEVHIGIFLISGAALLWVAFATRLPSVRAMAWVALPLVVVVGAGNALQHAVWTLRFHEYAPGVATGVGLVIPAAVWVVRRAAIPGGSPRLYVSALATLAVFGALQTWQSDRVPLPALEQLHAAIRAIVRALLANTSQ